LRVEIITHVKNLIVVVNGEIIDVDDSEEKGDGDTSAGLTLSDVTQVCRKLECACRRFDYSGTGLALPQELCGFRGFLRRMEMKSAKQTTL